MGDTRVKFFLTPDFDRLDSATSMMDAVEQQSGAMKSALIVASDRLDHIRLLARRIKIIPLRDIAKVEATARFSIDEALQLTAVVPKAASAQGRGRRAEQRDRTIPILDELDGEGIAVDKSNKTWRIVAERFKHRYPGVASPAKGSILSAIDCWLCSSK